MTAAAADTSDTSIALKAPKSTESVEHKVATNQIADPAKLAADSIAAAKKPGEPISPATQAAIAESSPARDKRWTPDSPVAKSLFEMPGSSFLSFDNSIYDGSACKINARTNDLFQLNDPNSIFAERSENLDFTATFKPFDARDSQQWSEARRNLVKHVADNTFNTVFDEPEDLEKVKKYDKVDNPQAAKILQGHKPGEEWKGEDGSSYRATNDGGLVHRKQNGDVEYYGKDGSSFSKVGKDERWSLHGETIEKHVDEKGHETYKKIFGDGSSVEITEDKDIKAINRLERLTVTQHKSRLSESRAAFDAARTGVNQHSDGQDYVKDDPSGDRLRKDDKHDYALLKTKDGKFYAVQNGHVYEFDIEHHRFSPAAVSDDKMPASLKRNADGSLQFNSIKLTAGNELTDAENGLDFKNKDHHIQARSAGQDVDLTVEHGQESIKVGDRNTVYDSNQDKLEVTEHGQPNLTFDYESRRLDSEGISFSPDQTEIDGEFSINELNDDLQFDDGKLWAGVSKAYDNDDDDPGYISQSGAAELRETLTQAMGLSSQIDTPGAQNAVLAQLYGLLGKLDGISGGIEIQAAVASSRGAINGQIAKVEEIGAINDRLFHAGQSNSTISEAINRRGPGTSDDFIVQQILEERA